MKIDRLIVNYLTVLRDIKRYSPNTIKSYGEDLHDFVKFLSSIQIKEIHAITLKSLKHYLMYMNEKRLDKKSISRKLAAIRGLFRYAYVNSLIRSNPSLQLANPKQERKLPEVVSLESILSLYNIIEEKEEEPIRVKLIFELLYGCALRVSELCSLNDNDVDLITNLIKVKGKGNKERLVPVGEKSKKIILEYKKWREKFPNRSAFVLDSKGIRIYPRYVHRIVNKYLTLVSDIKKKSPHVLRHAAATHMLNNGADIGAVKEILGHENLSTTQIYTHVSIERLKLAYKKAHPKS